MSGLPQHSVAAEKWFSQTDAPLLVNRDVKNFLTPYSMTAWPEGPDKGLADQGPERYIDTLNTILGVVKLALLYGITSLRAQYGSEAIISIEELRRCVNQSSSVVSKQPDAGSEHVVTERAKEKPTSAWRQVCICVFSTVPSPPNDENTCQELINTSLPLFNRVSLIPHTYFFHVSLRKGLRSTTLFKPLRP
eukprot:8515966-Pyramimonas_sp.AAC.2